MNRVNIICNNYFLFKTKMHNLQKMSNKLFYSTLAANVNATITLNLQKVTIQYSSLPETDFTVMMFKILLAVVLQN